MNRATAAIGAVIALSLGACARATSPAPGSDAELAAQLDAARAQTDRVASIERWRLDEAAWNRIVVAPFRTLYAAYAARFAQAAPRVLAAIPAHGAIHVRRHYAGDAALTRAQGRTRWALPVLYPSMVADVDGAMLDAVFVYDGDGWRVLAGIDDALLAAVHELDPACANELAKAGATGHCTEVGADLADAALRGDTPRFQHGCALAATLCKAAAP